MELLTQLTHKKIPENEIAGNLITKFKDIVYAYDCNAEIVLFGSRARGDWHKESDWDFLILTDINVNEKFKDELRNKILREIEAHLGESVFVIVKNKIEWEDDYAVTNIYQSISEEGIAV